VPRRSTLVRMALIAGLVGLALFECANVYFIMPMPGSQRMRSIDLAYALHQNRWIVRAIFGALVLIGGHALLSPLGVGWRRWALPLLALVSGGIVYVTNFRMAADQMFKQPRQLRLVPIAENTVAPQRLVVGVVRNGEARAYPLQFIGYHHQVRDSVGGEPVLVSYCTVCRTGRVFTPMVRQSLESFRLVGMDHFNAMLEDSRTGSWWRQANGEAVVGPLTGTRLAELPSAQMRLAQWASLHPKTLVMQADPAFTEEYAKDYAFEQGTSRKALTGTNTASWRDKSWVVGITERGRSVAFNWNRLERERAINASVGGVPIVLALGTDDASFVAFERPDSSTTFTLRGDSLVAGAAAWAFNGESPTARPLRAVVASQEFWHSWRTFQPSTTRY
jgi:hypothetical protein